jgi:succinate dehydrogenase / fumarate reductase, cytochrome b subunit
MKERPLSPHLSIYSWQITNTLSIFHRLAGVANIFTVLSLTFWLITLAIGEKAFDTYNNFLGLNAVKFLYFIGTQFLFYHLCNGIRHLSWDMGFGFSLRASKISGIAVVLLSFALNFLFWNWLV